MILASWKDNKLYGGTDLITFDANFYKSSVYKSEEEKKIVGLFVTLNMQLNIKNYA